MQKRCVVSLSKKATKQLKKLPIYVKEAALVWVRAVEEQGIRKVRLLPGYHDEPLRGQRKGQRSTRLTRSYRLFYVESDEKVEVLITVIEVNKHDY